MTRPSAFQASARFGLGAKPGELAGIGGDPRGWLLAQLASPTIPPELTRRYSHSSMVADVMLTPLDIPMREQMGPQGDEADKHLKFIQGATKKAYIQETGERIRAQIASGQPFIERLVMFWSNHFAVSIQRPLMASIANRYEVEAIRPHVTGYFADMLIAVCRHPAMIFYLDNIRSYGPNSPRGINHAKGMNENLAREVLELHTLGAGSGYTQNDVIALAKIFTGWTFDRNAAETEIQYKFMERAHEPGPKTLLGKIFRENGEQEGIEALTMLALHPATARHLATKIARHFIADEPPPAAISALEKSYRDSGGFLPAVMKTLIALDEPWTPFAKFKTPYEFAISAFRLTAQMPTPEVAVAGLEALNFRAFNAVSPAGDEDRAVAWASPDAVMKRIEWGHRLALMLPAGHDPLVLTQIALGGAASDDTRQAISRAPSGAEGIAMLLASPEFQRR